ncbi:MAG: hypothetical protein ACO3EP_00650 [Phycisphaerales bacterium]|jgi:hypothetical protein
MKHSLVIASGILLLAASLASADAGRKGRTDAPVAPITKEAPVSRESRQLPRNDDFRAGSSRLAALAGTSPSSCPNPGANPVTSNASGDLSVGGIACGGGGITTANTYARIFTQSQLGTAYTVNCINFGVLNTGSPLPGTVALWRDPSGGNPSIAELQLIASYEVNLTTGAEQLLSVSGDPVCIEIGANETLVVTLDYPASNDGFCTFTGGVAASSPTYIYASACGLTDFANLASIGFPNNQWYVELSGDFGCGDGVIGDLNADGIVNGADLSILLGAWGSSDPIADLSGDGEVGGADLSILLGNWTS